jgi:hypothetical protein
MSFDLAAMYERAGSISRYLPLYLRQIVEHGYDDAPFEVDARMHELESAA